ncbi:unnamed protein product [Caenorhabditis sp. 36 PRJEB53466]|nr:unnamed protein product [Caenorhabditis sp. 36 PRJEB53466]
MNRFLSDLLNCCDPDENPCSRKKEVVEDVVSSSGDSMATAAGQRSKTPPKHSNLLKTLSIQNSIDVSNNEMA